MCPTERTEQDIPQEVDEALSKNLVGVSNNGSIIYNYRMAKGSGRQNLSISEKMKSRNTREVHTRS